MTSNQIAYQRALEERRHNLEMEKQGYANVDIAARDLNRRIVYDRESLRDVDLKRDQDRYLNRLGLVNARDIAQMNNMTQREISSMDRAARVYTSNKDRESRQEIALQDRSSRENIASQDRMLSWDINQARWANELAINSARNAASLQAAQISANAHTSSALIGAGASRDVARITAANRSAIAAADRAVESQKVNAYVGLTNAQASKVGSEAAYGWGSVDDRLRMTNAEMQSADMKAFTDTVTAPATIAGGYVKAISPFAGLFK